MLGIYKCYNVSKNFASFIHIICAGTFKIWFNMSLANVKKTKKNLATALVRFFWLSGVEFIENSCFLFVKAMHGDECVGAIVCKLDIHRKVIKRGYIAMLAVDVKFRKRKIGSNLVRRAIQAMVKDDADEVVLETEITNRPALRLYENLGFVRDKRLFRYYLNGVDALRLKLWLRWNSSTCLCQ